MPDNATNVFQLMAERIDARFAPVGNQAPPFWVINGQCALLDWDHHLRTRGIFPSPLVPLIEQLHAEGWKRGGWCNDYPGIWELHAYIRSSDAEIRIAGTALACDHPDRDPMWSFWAPPPPKLPRRPQAAFRQEYEEFMRKCREDEW